MYVPRQFREERPEVLAAAVRGLQLATLVTAGPDGLLVSHVPMRLAIGADGAWELTAHVARPNPHWSLAGSGPSVAVFQGPHAYISPSWYPSKREHGRVVPTWTYIAVHAHGRLEAIEDEAWLRAHLGALTEANEGGRAQPWGIGDAPEDYVRGLTRAIVGLRLAVTLVEGAWKMNQHRSEADRLGAIGGLGAEPGGEAVAVVMRALDAARSR